jgi:hypothetical protein
LMQMLLGLPRELSPQMTSVTAVLILECHVHTAPQKQPVL